MKKLLIIISVAIIGFNSCKKDVPPVVTSPNVATEARDNLYDVMNEYYFWYSLMPAVVKPTTRTHHRSWRQ
jgi:hypothetical protein